MPEESSIERFPSNSLTKPTEQKPRNAKDVKPVIEKGKARVRKQTFSERFADAMLAMNLKDAIVGTIRDILVPAAKDAFVDAVDGAANRLAYGDGARRHRGRNGEVDYNRISTQRRRGEPEPVRPRPRNFVRDLTFDTRSDALEVLQNLRDLLDEYQVVSVMDVYSSSGLKTDPTQDNWGWFDLDDVDLEHTREGWVLNLPKPQRID